MVVFSAVGFAQSPQDDFIRASVYGLTAQASPSDNQRALQAIMNDIASGKAPATLLLPRGQIRIDGTVSLPALSGETPASKLQVIIRGVGAGENGSWLHFSSGSLRIQAANHLIEDFRITSDDSDALIIEAQSGGAAPSRSALRNIRAENSAGSGIVISGSWIHLFENVFARFNRGWGIEGRAGTTFGISANALTIIGGELQGNGSIEGTPVNSGGSKAGSGGGIITGPLVQLSLNGTAVEGNLGDGIFISEGATSVNLQNVYFEKNGSHPDNRDVGNRPPSRPGLGPRSVVISGANFTASNRNGTAQRRAIELWDTRGLLIRTPIFFGSPSASYAVEPIVIRETAGGVASGWVELPEYRWTGYRADFVRNETLRFGFPRKAYFQSSRALGSVPVQARVPISPMAGRRVELVSLFDGAHSAAHSAEVETRFSRGPRGGTSAIRRDVVKRSNNERHMRLDHKTNLPIGSRDYVQIDIASVGAAPGLRLLSIEVTTYEPVIAM